MFLSVLFTPWSLLALPVLFFLLPYIRNWQIRDIPGPFLAKFSNLWYLYECRRGRRYATVKELHDKYGKLLRIQPNHVSIADPETIPVIYGHGTGFLKSSVIFWPITNPEVKVAKWTSGITTTLSSPSNAVSSIPATEQSTHGREKPYPTHSAPKTWANLNNIFITILRCSQSNGTRGARNRMVVTINLTPCIGSTTSHSTSSETWPLERHSGW